MANDLTLTSPVFNTSGKFGQSLSGGRGNASNLTIPTGYPITIEGWGKTTFSTLQVLAGQGGYAWIGCNASGKAVAYYGNTTERTLLSNVTISDGVNHHLELILTASGARLYVDGIEAATSTQVGDTSRTAAPSFGVRCFGQTTYNSALDWKGEVDEVAITAGEKHTANFTPSIVANDSPGLVAVWHLDGNGVNSAGVVSTDTTPPTMNGAITVSARTATGFTLAWPAASDNEAVANYEVDSGGGAYASAGNVLTIPVAGKAAATSYNVRVRAVDAAGNPATPLTATATTTAAPAALDTTKILFSPGNWEVGATVARTINAGAYLKTLFGGANCTLSFDLTGLSGNLPLLVYRVDEYGPWQTATLAASVAITMPAETASWSTHYLELMVRSTSEAVARWTGAVTVALTGVTLDSGKVLTKPAPLPLSGWYFGDSITEGVNTLTNQGDNTLRSSAAQGWAYLSARALGAECGVIGFGGQGLVVGGAGSVPIFGLTFDKLRSGVARPFTEPPNFVVINQGTNDGANNITANATAALNGLIAALPSSTKIIVLRPFNGTHDAQWVAAIAACSAPSRITYVNTTGWFNTANASDALHPYGFENIRNIGPMATAAIGAVLDGAAVPPTLTQRTVAFTLASGKGANDVAIPAANLSNLSVSFHDEPAPGAATVPRYKSSTESTDSAGLITFTVMSTLAPGAYGHLTILGAAGVHYNGPVAVS